MQFNYSLTRYIQVCMCIRHKQGFTPSKRTELAKADKLKGDIVLRQFVSEI